MNFIAFAIFLILTVIAGIHVAWAAGMRWPRKTEAELVKTVIGHHGNKMPTLGQCCVAALVIVIPGAIALLLAGLVKTPMPSWLVVLAGAGATVIFAGRGLAGYTPAWRARHPCEPFASLDRHYFRRFACYLPLALSL